MTLLTRLLIVLAVIVAIASLALLAAIWWELRYIRTRRRPALLDDLYPPRRRFL